MKQFKKVLITAFILMIWLCMAQTNKGYAQVTTLPFEYGPGGDGRTLQLPPNATVTLEVVGGGGAYSSYLSPFHPLPFTS